jgi:hypothetical protein
VATASGTPQFTGFIYAPNASLTIDGGGSPSTDTIVGGVVVNDATVNWNGALEYGDPGDLALEFEPIDTINSLQVTANRIEVRPD